MKSFMILTCFIFITQATSHDHVDYTHNKPPETTKCTLEEECDAAEPDRVRKCSSLDLCYDYEGHNPGGHTRKEFGKESKCPETETCAQADGPEGEPFHVCVLEMYCNMTSAAIYRGERNATWNGEWQEPVPFTCPNLREKEIAAAANECAKLSYNPLTREEEFLKEIEYDKSLRMSPEQLAILRNTSLDHNGDPYFPYGF